MINGLNLTHRIRERAYEIWAASGYSDGRADQHWLAAEREISKILVAAQPARRIAEKKVSRSLSARKTQKKPQPLSYAK